MATYKNISVPKRGGGTRTQRVQVLKSGKYKFVKNTGTKVKAKSSTKKRRKTNPKGGNKRRMARKKRRSNRKFTLPLAVALPLAGSFVTNMGESSIGSGGVVADLMAGRFDYAGRDAMLLFTGFDSVNGKWDLRRAKGLIGLGIGFVVHKLASMLGINRALGRARVPIIRI